MIGLPTNKKTKKTVRPETQESAEAVSNIQSPSAADIITQIPDSLQQVGDPKEANNECLKALRYSPYFHNPIIFDNYCTLLQFWTA